MVLKQQKLIARLGYCWPAVVYTSAADGFSVVPPHQGDHRHTGVGVIGGGIKENITNSMEVGGMDGDERLRGIIILDLTNAEAVDQAFIDLVVVDANSLSETFADAPNGGLFGQPPFDGTLSLRRFVPSSSSGSPADFAATEVETIDTFVASQLPVDHRRSIDITAAYNAGIGSLVGFKLRTIVDDVQSARDEGAVVFGDVCVRLPKTPSLSAVGSYEIGLNVGVSNSDSFARYRVDSAESIIWYRDQTTGGSIDHATGLPNGTGLTKATIQFRAGSKYPPGTYVATWPGSGTIDGNSSPYTFSITTETSKTFNLTGSLGGSFSLKLQGATGTYEATAISRFSKMKTLRFMEEAFTNSTVVQYDPANPYMRRRTSGANERFIPTPTPERLADICMAMGNDLWYCFHHEATDANIIDFVDRLVAAGYNRKFIAEWSNEIWNNFPQGQAIENAAIATGNYEGVTGGAAQQLVKKRQAYYADESNRIGGIIKGRYANSEMVLACQTASPSYFNYWINDSVAGGVFPNIDRVAVSFYFGGPPTRLPSMDEATALSQTAASLAAIGLDDWTNRVIAFIQTWKTQVEGIGKVLDFYEGGSHYWNDSATATEHLASINRTAENAAVWGAVLDWLNTNCPGSRLMVFQGIGDPDDAWTTIGPELATGSPTWAEVISRV